MQLCETKEIKTIIDTLDLTVNEAEVYFYLLRNGTVVGASIYQQLGMDKSSCYRALASLRKKNLIKAIGEERNQQFGANDPEMLFEIMQRKRNELDTHADKLEQFIETLTSDIGENYLQRNVEVLDGIEGHRLFLEDRLSSKQKLIREIGGRSAAKAYFDDYDAYMTDYIPRRVKVGIFLKQLVPFGEVDEMWERSSKKMNKEARELPKSFKASAMLSTWDDKTGFISKEGGDIIGFIVRDKLITELCNSLFDMIWDILEEDRS